MQGWEVMTQLCASSQLSIIRRWSRQVDRTTDGWRKEIEGEEEKAGHQLLCWLFRYVQQKETECEGLKWGKRPCCNAITCWWKMTAGWDLLIPLIQAWDHSEYNYQTTQTLTDWLTVTVAIKAANDSLCLFHLHNETVSILLATWFGLLCPLCCIA